MEICLSVFRETETLTLKRRRKMMFLSGGVAANPKKNGKMSLEMQNF